MSLRGNDKPTITNNPPADDTQPANSPVTQDATTSPSSSPAPADSDEPENDKPGNGHHNGNGNHDNDDDASPQDDEKARGLARAAEVHQRNIDRMTEKGKTVPQGLQMSLDKLVTMNADRLSDEQATLHGNNGQHKGQTQGHHADT